MGKQVAKQSEDPPIFIRIGRLRWGESNISFSSLITPSSHEMLKCKAAEMRLSKSDLIQYLSRCLSDPDVEAAVRRQITLDSNSMHQK